MSVTLERCYDNVMKKYIYVNAVACTETYDECRDPATGDYGVYCDSTFYPRCWNGTGYDCVVGDACCVEMGGCNCPRYVGLTFSGVTICVDHMEWCGDCSSGDNAAEALNATSLVVDLGASACSGTAVSDTFSCDGVDYTIYAVVAYGWLANYWTLSVAISGDLYCNEMGLFCAVLGDEDIECDGEQVVDNAIEQGDCCLYSCGALRKSCFIDWDLVRSQTAYGGQATITWGV